MAHASTFHCSVVTPERSVLDCEARFAAFTAHDGEIGILPGRAPLLCRLGIGTLRVESPQQTHRFFIDGGFAQMVENRLTILTEQARLPQELSTQAARAALDKALEMPMRDEASRAARQKAVERARVQVRLAEHS